ncbi:hypothetical protein, partial [Mycobacterium tuberculosis]|uniref:hypothetical protein n=1 Tax=Mycobacterium tuberculosis TaxID=1773 RepID=UPI000E385E66
GPGGHAAAATGRPGGAEGRAAAGGGDEAGGTAEARRQQRAERVPAHRRPRHGTRRDRSPGTDSGKSDRAEGGALLAAEVER